MSGQESPQTLAALANLASHVGTMTELVVVMRSEIIAMTESIADLRGRIVKLESKCYEKQRPAHLN